MSVKVDYIYEGIQPDQETFVTQGLVERKVRSVTCNPIILNLVEEVDTDMAVHIARQLNEAENKGQPFVPCFIQSCGGDTYALMCIVEAIRQSKVPVYTIVTGLAASAAACIFSCGKRRFMSKNAKLLLHDVSVDFGEDASLTTSNLKVEAKEMRRLNRTIFRVMADNTGNEPNFFSDVVGSKRHNDIYVDAKQAVKWNLATDLGFPVMKVTTTIKMECEVRPSFGMLRQHEKDKDKITEEKKEEKKDEKSSDAVPEPPVKPARSRINLRSRKRKTQPTEESDSSDSEPESPRLKKRAKRRRKEPKAVETSSDSESGSSDSEDSDA